MVKEWWFTIIRVENLEGNCVFKENYPHPHQRTNGTTSWSGANSAFEEKKFRLIMKEKITWLIRGRRRAEWRTQAAAQATMQAISFSS